MSRSSTCTFTNARGHDLAARLERPVGAPVGVALFAHCFTCSKDLKVERQLTRALTAQGFAVLSFDFAGLGRSGGDFADSSFSADVDDLRAAAEYLGEVVGSPSLLVGHSLGGAAVLSVAPELPSVRAVATIGAPADPAHVLHLLDGDLDAIRRDGSAPVTIGGRTFTVGQSFVDDLTLNDPSSSAAQFRGATLILHSPVDEVVGIDNAETIYRASRHPKSFVSLDNADHLVSRKADAQYAASVVATWARRYVDESAATPGSSGSNQFQDSVVSATNNGGLTTNLQARGFSLLADEPDAVGGNELGPTPYDFLNLALAACTAMTLRMYADRKKWPLDEVVVTVSHDRVHANDCAECEHEAGQIELLTRTLRITGDLDDDQRQALQRIADRCPVHRSLEGQIEVHTTHVE